MSSVKSSDRTLISSFFFFFSPCSRTGRTIKDSFGTVAVLVLSNFKDNPKYKIGEKKHTSELIKVSFGRVEWLLL